MFDANKSFDDNLSAFLAECVAVDADCAKILSDNISILRDHGADRDAFLDRGKDDRHQFRFIVSPEDAAGLADLTGYTRELMGRIEIDLGTVNHHNTGHPHVHVIVNGRDALGGDLVINGDYLANGIRDRASELATLELGPVTEIEQHRKLMAEIDQDRLTRIDRAMIAEAEDRLLDLRYEADDLRGQSDRTMRLRRLGKLGDMGLATEHAPGVWELSERLEPTLREMGERGDIIRTMQKALRAEGTERDPMSFEIHGSAPASPVIDRQLGREVAGIVRGGSVSWQLGRQRGLGL